MLNLTALLGIAPSSKKEKKVQEPPKNNIAVDMRRKINAGESFDFVYVQLSRQNGKLVSDPNYLCGLIGGQMWGKRSVGVVVPFGKAQSVYDAVEKLSEAPFPSEVNIGHSSYSGHYEDDVNVVWEILSSAQRYRAHRTYAGKQPQPSASLGERILETA